MKMKKVILTISIVLLFSGLIKSQGNNSLYPDALRVSSGVYFDNTITDRFIFAIKEHQAKPLFEYIMENILNGNVNAYNPYGFSDM